MAVFPPTRDYESIRSEIQSGDILLCSGTSFFARLIQDATRSPWSHVAFVLRLDIIGRIFVLESVESIGVRAVTLSSYVKDYNGTGKAYPGRIMLARHSDLRESNIKSLSRYATNLLGYPYDKREILRIAARISKNYVGLDNPGSDPLSKSEFICSEYAYECFKSVGVQIDFGPLGFIAPSDFACCKKVTPLAFIESK